MSVEAPAAVLAVERVRAGYGQAEVVRDLSFDVAHGEIVAILGPNGAGKTTLLRCVAGLHPLRAGSVRIDGRDVTGSTAEQLARRGAALVPEGRQLFAALTVEDNLRVALNGCAPRRDRAERERRLGLAFDAFPALRALRGRVAATLSGGEQQMVAIGRALVREPRLLLLDEPSFGLAPLVVEAIFELLRRLRSDGSAIVLVEQHEAALDVADRGYRMERGALRAAVR